MRCSLCCLVASPEFTAAVVVSFVCSVSPVHAFIAAAMSKDLISEEISELRAEAAEARRLASTFEDSASVTDLLNYASALDNEATQLEKAFRKKSSRGLLAACLMCFRGAFGHHGGRS